MKIVVTGSLGHIGKPLTEQLIQAENDVVVISSSSERKGEIEDLGAKAAIGSLEDVAFLVKTFEGAEALFAMVPPAFQEADQVAYYKRLANGYAEAIKKAGVKRVVYLSSYGAHLSSGTGFILGAHFAERILDAVPDISITHLRPGYFYYNLFGMMDMIKTAGFIGANYGGDDNLIFVAPEDIAAVAAAELQKIGSVDKYHYIVSEEMTANEAAKMLGDAIGKPDLEWKTFPDEVAKQTMEKRGMPPHVVTNFIELGQSIHSGRLMQDYYRHKQEATHGKIKLKDFAEKEFAPAFQKSF